MDSSRNNDHCPCCQRLLSQNLTLTVSDIDDLVKLKDLLSLAKIEFGQKGVTTKKLSSLTKFKHLKLLELIRKDPRYFRFGSTTVNKKTLIYIQDIYSDLAENPETDEWLDVQKREYSKTIQLSLYNNYGYIHGYYIEPSDDYDREHLYLNTLEKIEEIKKIVNPSPASYTLGGFGDSTQIRPKKWVGVDFGDD